MTEAMDREKKCAATTIGWIRKTESTLWMQKMDLILLIIFYNEKGVKKNFEWQHSNPFAHNELANLFDGTHKAFRLLTMHKKKKEGCLIEAVDFFSILGWENQLSFMRL